MAFYLSRRGVLLGIAITSLNAAQSHSQPRTGQGTRYYGTFSGSPIVRLDPDGQRITVLQPFFFIDAEHQKWDVPESCISDGASIPRAFWTLIGSPLTGPYRDGAIIHDYYCEHFFMRWAEEYKRDWKKVHKAFYYAMRTRKVTEIKAKTLYGAVFHFGPRWDLEGNRVRRWRPNKIPKQTADRLIAFIVRSNPTLEAIEAFDALQGIEYIPGPWTDVRDL